MTPCQASVEMTAIAQYPELQYSLIINYIDLVSSHYEAGPLQSTAPNYNGPLDERIERILKALAKLSRWAYAAEDVLAQVRAAEDAGPETKKRRSLGVPDTPHYIDSSMSNYNGFTNNKPGPSVFFSPISISLPSIQTLFERPRHPSQTPIPR